MAQKNYYDVKTPEFRVSFPHLFEPSKFEGEEQGSYSLVMAFDNAADLKPLREACRKAIADVWPKGAPTNLRSPLCDGNEKAESWGENFRNTIYARAKSKRRPPVVDARGLPVDDPEAVYPGCYARAVVTPFVYDRAGNRGVGLQLAALQILRDGERLGGDGGGSRALAMLGAVDGSAVSFNPTTLDEI